MSTLWRASHPAAEAAGRATPWQGLCPCTPPGGGTPPGPALCSSSTLPLPAPLEYHARRAPPFDALPRELSRRGRATRHDEVEDTRSCGPESSSGALAPARERKAASAVAPPPPSRTVWRTETMTVYRKPVL